ncbi:MAG TPA: sigma 54-interacting transcriptional regulator, partial [Polyangiales bacterium]|nr:sigma 54-interacting transcriptional regulator [Polyangiales bacterium]
RREGAVVRLADLDSRNGCWVGGRRVADAELRVGDVAVLGGLSLSVQLRPAYEPALLGVHGAASVMQYLEAECARCQLLRRPLSVIVTRAAAPADLALAELAAHCADLASPIDRVGLYDREVLLAVLPETEPEAAARRAQAISETKRGGALCGVASLSHAVRGSEQLVSAALRALRSASPARPWIVAGPAGPRRVADDAPLVLRNTAMLELERLVQRLASKRIAVLVLGETGSGKELVARALHTRGARRAGPFKVVNCAAIPEQLVESVLFGHVKGAFTGADRDQPGAFVQAHGGTIFLDEVGELSASAQAALLRTLDTQRVAAVGGQHEVSVDLRVVAATHRDLAAMTADGTFRLDLYHRLNAVMLRVPPLRERPEELELLIQTFLKEFGSDGGAARPFSPEALARLRAYPWPGNVRELRNVVERALAISDGPQIELADLPTHIAQHACNAPSVSAALQPESSGQDLRAQVQAYEAQLIGDALRSSDGNQRRAAGLLRLPLRTFERKLQLLGTRVPRPRRA